MTERNSNPPLGGCNPSSSVDGGPAALNAPEKTLSDLIVEHEEAIVPLLELVDLTPLDAQNHFLMKLAVNQMDKANFNFYQMLREKAEGSWQ